MIASPGKMKLDKNPMIGAVVFSLLASTECLPDELHGPRAAPAEKPAAGPAATDYFVSPRGNDDRFEAPWGTVDQPDLKQALEKAPVLQTESLGEPARGVNERWFVPNLDGRTWDMLQGEFETHRPKPGCYTLRASGNAES